MIPVLRAEDVRALDSAAEAAGTPITALMERAGWAVARAARGMLGGTYGRRIVVLAGKGNNGGDGIVAARILRAQGAHATVVAIADPQAMSEHARGALARFGGPARALGDAAREIERCDLVIDALLGVGMSRAPEGPVLEAIRAARDARAVLAVDVPSGVDADTGAVPGDAVRADRTVSFAGWKPGLLFEPGAGHAGEVELAAIGTPEPARAAAWALDRSTLAASLPGRARAGHKRDAGTVLVVAGSRAMPGAAVLATAAAVHAGAGLTTLCAPEDVCRVVLARVPEITTIPVPESAEGTIDAKALDLLGPRLDTFDALAIGPGLTTHPATVELVRSLVRAAAAPLVLDADGLNAFTEAPDELAAREAPTVLTPHAGELARLLNGSAAHLNADRLAAATRAARAFGATVVFKGPGTVIADRDGACFVNVSGGAALAQGGTGDVLTGIVGAFLAHEARAAGEASPAVVAAAVALHGLAADRLAARLAPHPANASALIDELGPTMHDVAHG